MRRCLVVVGLAVVALAWGGVGTARAADDPGHLVDLTNQARASAGLAPLADSDELTGVAQDQAARMAARHVVYHNPNLATDVSDWRRVGENVADGSTVDGVHESFMNSSDHRSNILSSYYTEIGVGLARGDDGVLYVSEVFRQPMSNAAPAEPASATPVASTADTAPADPPSVDAAAAPPTTVATELPPAPEPPAITAFPGGPDGATDGTTTAHAYTYRYASLVTGDLDELRQRAVAGGFAAFLAGAVLTSNVSVLLRRRAGTRGRFAILASRTSPR